MSILSQRGWKQVNRAIMEHWVWKVKIFDTLHAWMDIYLSVNHAPAYVTFNGRDIVVDADCMLTSETKLADRWGWSRTKVSTFLKKLEKDGLISIERVGKATYLRVHSDAEISSIESRLCTDEELLKSSLCADKKQLKDTNNNNNNNKNNKNDDNKKNIYSADKIKYAESVSLTKEEYEALVDRLGEVGAELAVKKLDDYKSAHGREYASDYRAMENWVIEAVEKDRKKAQRPQEEYELLKTEESDDEFERIMWEKMGWFSELEKINS